MGEHIRQEIRSERNDERSLSDTHIPREGSIYPNLVREDLRDTEHLLSKLYAGDFEPGTTIRAVGHADGPTMGVSYLLDDREAKPGSLHSG